MMKSLTAALLAELKAGRRAVLCSILRSGGSTPRTVGAKMAVLADGRLLGTVGGGNVERLAGLYAGDLLRACRSAVRYYELQTGDPDSTGMVCGGDLLLGFQCLDPAREDHRAALADLESALADSAPVWLKTVITADGDTTLAVLREDLHDDGPALPRTAALDETGGTWTLTEPLAVRETVWLFGGGHVGAALVPALDAVGFSVTVFDPRPEIAVPARFPQARQVLLGSFDDVLSQVRIGPADYVIVLTPAHRMDYEVLRQVLTTKATYIGCIGSAKKVAYVNAKLRADGFSEAEIARIHAPIGLPILAETPAEIAVSITAQLILHRHGAAKN